MFLVSTDDFAGWLALQTNLALKGIIGIKAMAGISKVLNDDSLYEHYDVSFINPIHELYSNTVRISLVPTSPSGKN